MNVIRNRVNKAILRAYVGAVLTGWSAARSVRDKLSERDGSYFTENGLNIVIVVVIAGILLTLLVALMKDKIFPQLNSKVDSFFAIS